MKLHDFACSACGKRFEDLVRDGETPACPACGSAQVQKQISGFAIGGARASEPALDGGCAGGACGFGASGLGGACGD